MPVVNIPELPKVWVTKDGFPYRISHMDTDHIYNAIEWLLENPRNCDLTAYKDGHSVHAWVMALTNELRNRVHGG